MQGLKKLAKEDILDLKIEELNDAFDILKEKYSLVDFHIEEILEKDMRNEDITARLIEDIDLNDENIKIPFINIQKNKDCIFFQ